MIIILTIGAYKFHKAAKTDTIGYIKKRYPNLVIAICIVSIIAYIRQSYFLIAIESGLIPPTSPAFDLSMNIFQTVRCMIITSHQWLTILRLWMIYYDLCWTSSNFNSQWIHHINPNLIERDFWLKHRKTIGNYKICKITTFTLCIIVTIIYIAMLQYGFYFKDTFSTLFNSLNSSVSVSAAIMTIFFVILSMKLKCRISFEDKLWIRTEFNMIVALKFLTTITFETWSIWFTGNWTIYSFIFNIPHIVSLVSTYYILYKCRVLYNSDSYAKITELEMVQTDGVAKLASHSVECEEMSASKTDSNNNLVRRLFSITDIFMDYKQFEKFMKYMMKEFAMESGLCILELVEFKYHMKKMFGDVIDHEMDLVWNVDGFPKSWIVYESYQGKIPTKRAFVNMVRLLGDKYIAFGSDLEINISYTNRTQLIAKIDRLQEHLMDSDEEDGNDDSIDMNELFCLFDDTMNEMKYLLKQSYFRFMANSAS